MIRVGSTPVSLDWRREREVRRRRERALPPGLRADVRKVRRDDLAQDVLDLIDDRLQLEARRELRAEDADGNIDIMPVARRKLLRALDINLEFRGFIRNSIDSLLRTSHLAKTDPEQVAILPGTLPAAPQPTHGILALRSSIGLGTATYLEAEPEQWCQYVVDRALARVQPEPDGDVTLEDYRTLRVFAFGAGPGGIARAATALESQARIEVAEQDSVLPERMEMPCVVEVRGPTDGRHDVVVMVLPCPADGGAANHRRIYTEDHLRAFDLSALGPKAWSAQVDAWIGALPQLLTPAGEAFILAPASLRRETGYVRHVGLLETVLRALSAAGLQVVEQVRIVEVEPVNQPFVSRARPERWSLRVRRATSPAVAEVGHA